MLQNADSVGNNVTDLSTEGNNNQNSLFKILHRMKMKTVALIIIPIATIGALALFGFLFMYPMISPSTGSDNLTPTQKKEIYKNILANNSQMQSINQVDNFKATEGAANLDAVNAEPVAMSVDEKRIVPLPWTDDTAGKLITTTFKNVTGPKSTECKAIFDSQYAYPEETVSLSYYDNNGYSVSRNIEKYGDIEFVYRSVSTPENSDNLDYKGGKYAVRSTYKYAPVDSSTSAEMPAVEYKDPGVNYSPLEVRNPETQEPVELDIEAQIRQFFGEDVDIVGMEEIEGKKYYLLEYSYETPCDIDYSKMPIVNKVDFWNGEYYEEQKNNTKNEKIVIRNYVDVADYSIYKSSSYLESSQDGNLIYSYITEVDKSESSYEKALEVTEIELAVPIKEYKYDGSTTEYDARAQNKKVVDYIDSKKYPVVDLSGMGYIISNVYSNDYYVQNVQVDDFSELLMNRDFYPEGELGDRIYELYTGYNKTYVYEAPALVEYIYKTATLPTEGDVSNELYSNLTASIAKKSFSDLEIINSLIYSPVKTKSIEDYELTVNGVKLVAKLYKYQTQYEGIVYDDTYNIPESEEGGSTKSGEAVVKERMLIEPIDPGMGDQPIMNNTDSGYFVIFEIEGTDYKLVFRDTAMGSEAYPETLGKLQAGNIKLISIPDFGKTKLLDAITPDDNFLPMPIEEPMVKEGQR